MSAPDNHAAAVEALRSWFHDHTGKRIFYRNASKAVDRIRAALAADAPAKREERE